MTKRNKYPVEVPVLSARDMITGKYGSKNCHCLAGWVRFVFLKRNTGTLLQSEVMAAGFQRVTECILRAGKKICPKFAATKAKSITILNDAYCRNNVQRAAVWNLAMFYLGYTEGNPQPES